MPVQPAGSLLEQARAHFAERAWADAREAFEAAEREAPLGVDDEESVALCAWLLAYDDELVAALERAYTLHLAAGNDERAALAAFWLGSRLMFWGEFGRAGGWLARLAEIAARSGEQSVVHGYLLLTAANKHIFAKELDQAAEALTRATAIAKRAGDLDLEALTQSGLGRILMRKGEVERGLSLLDLSMLTASAESVSPKVTGIVCCAAIDNCNRIFALDRAREWTRQLARFCDAQPQMLSFSGTCLVHCSEVHQACGDWPAAEREAERACERVPKAGSANSGPLAPALYQRAELKRLYGELDAAEQLYRAASEAGHDPQPGLSLLRLAQGRPDQAAIALRRVLSAQADRHDRLRFLPASVEVFLAAGQVDDARALVAELESAVERQPTDVLRAMATHARGSLHLAEGAPQAALSPLRSSFDIWQSLGAPYLAARVRVELGQACRALGDLDGAELEFVAARALFERLGAHHDLVKLSEAPAQTGAAGLTARELEVLRLVASGKTNKAIAAELHLSEKTVDRHVSNIFVKLDVASRAAATAYAYQHQLL